MNHPKVVPTESDFNVNTILGGVALAVLIAAIMH